LPDKNGYIGYMKKASISETKNHLSELIDAVRHGETVLILHRRRPVARLEPVAGPGNTEIEGRLERLERSGIVRRGHPGPWSETVKKPPPRPRGRVSPVQMLIEERREGR